MLRIISDFVIGESLAKREPVPLKIFSLTLLVFCINIVKYGIDIFSIYLEIVNWNLNGIREFGLV